MMCDPNNEETTRRTCSAITPHWSLLNAEINLKSYFTCVENWKCTIQYSAVQYCAVRTMYLCRHVVDVGLMPVLWNTTHGTRLWCNKCCEESNEHLRTHCDVSDDRFDFSTTLPHDCYDLFCHKGVVANSLHSFFAPHGLSSMQYRWIGIGI